MLEKGEVGVPTVSTEVKGQFNWRALKTGDTASLGELGLKSNLYRME